jgi:hypothetical protein
MKRFLRYLFFSAISFYFIQLLYFPFSFSDARLGILYLISIFVITTFFSRTFLKIIRLPHEGLGFLVINILIHSLAVYLGALYLKKFDFIPLNFNKLDLFGIIKTPEVFLEKYTSLAMFSTLYCLMFGFLYFISWTPHEKKK